MRALAVAGLFVSIAIISVASAPRAPQARAIELYRSRTCSCCLRWVEYVRGHGLTVKVIDVDDLDAIKERHHVPPDLYSCHTTLVDGYVVEGHLPIADIERLRRERPQIAGIAVPGMPIGSPGMEGSSPEGYDVLSFDARGTVKVFSSHR